MPRLSTLKFSQRHILLDGKPFNAEQWPWINEPLAYLDKYRGATFLIRASIQSFKSGLAQLFNARQLYMEPGRALWYSKTDPAVAEFAVEKWNPLIDNCGPVQQTLYDNPHKRTTLTIAHPFGHFQMLTAGATMSRNSKSARDITADEAWDYEQGWLTEIQGRYSSFEGAHRFIIPTSGEDVGSEVNMIWHESTQSQWHVVCPHPGCHKPFVPSFSSHLDPEAPGGLKFDRSSKVFREDGRINSVALAATVRLECPHCQQVIPYSPATQAALNNPKNGARHIALNPDPKPRVFAWNWNALCHMNWHNMAELRLKAELSLARGDSSLIEDFIRKREARAYDIREFVRSSSVDAAQGDYPLSETPDPDALFHTLQIDVQQDHYWYLVRAWFKDVSSKLMAYGKAVSPSQLREIQLQYGVKDHGGMVVFDPETRQITMPNGCGVFIDGNYNTSQVRRLAATYHWCVLRGDDCKEFMHKDGFRRIYADIQAIDTFEGTGQTGVDRYVPEIRFSNNAARSRLVLMRSLEQPRRLWTFASNVDETYKRHMNAWVQVEKRHAKSNAVVHEWKQVADRDDLFWCEKASIVVASMAGLIGQAEATPTAPEGS